MYENEARPVCFLSSDARRAEFLPNKLTVFLNGFRFFTTDNTRRIPIEKFYDSWKIFKRNRLGVKNDKNLGFDRKHARSQIDPNKDFDPFHKSVFYFEYSSTNISLLLLFEFRTVVPKNFEPKSAVFGLAL